MERLHWFAMPRLALAGWHPGRNVWKRMKLPESFEPHPIAKRILTEFGKLKIGPNDNYTRFEPSVEEGVASAIKRFEKEIGRRLYPWDSGNTKIASTF